jgi:uncharacterized protein YkwD
MGHQRALIERIHNERIATLKADEDLAEVALSFPSCLRQGGKNGNSILVRNGVRVKGRRALRSALALAVLVASALLAASAFASARSERSLQTLNRQVLDAVNRFRLAHHLHPLRESPGLDSSARQHSLQMGRVGYFAHSSANGTPFWQRIRHYYAARGHSYWSVGENLLWAAPSVSVGHAMSMWIASPEHLRNLLTPQWHELGVSAVRVMRAPGVFHGLRVVIITTDFGVRR